MGGRGDTRTTIVLVAERLFAERGIGTVSLREIVAEAGQRNKSVIQYHFGPAADLVEAVFEYRMGRVNARRLEVLAEMHAAGRATDLGSLVEALVLPLVEVVAEPGCHYARFMAQFFAHPTYRVSPDRDIAQSLWLVEDGARRALPELSEEIFDERWRMVSHLFVQTVADHEGSRAETPGSPGATPGWARRLVAACVALLDAEPSTESSRTRALHGASTPGG